MGSSGRRERRRASKRKFVDNQHTLKRTEMNDLKASSANFGSITTTDNTRATGSHTPQTNFCIS